MQQEIRFCTGPGGVRIAYAVHGDGPGLPLVRVMTWLTHLERDLTTYGHWLEDLAHDRRFVRYDMRGCGLSDREVEDLSLDAKIGDLEAVVDAAGLDRFDLLGVSGGGPVAIGYAVRHPWRVGHLVVYGGYARGHGSRARTPQEVEEERLLVSLTRVGWGRPDPTFRSVFAQIFMPGATSQELESYDELQRLSATAEMAARIREAGHRVDVSDLVGRVRVPTLVMHVRGDAATPLEEGRHLAASIPGARFVTLPGNRHILGRDDPAWGAFVDELRRFCNDSTEPGPMLPALTTREHDVLALVADGFDNDAIAARLGLSVRTVERHLGNIYLKLGVSGRAARAAAVARYVRAH